MVYKKHIYDPHAVQSLRPMPGIVDPERPTLHDLYTMAALTGMLTGITRGPLDNSFVQLARMYADVAMAAREAAK